MHAGLCFITSRNYSVIEKREIIEGRILNLKCESKAEPGTINLVGFYGHTSNKAVSLRQDTVNALKDALSMTHTNVSVNSKPDHRQNPRTIFSMGEFPTP